MFTRWSRFVALGPGPSSSRRGFTATRRRGRSRCSRTRAELVAYAAARDVGLRLYPCINPSGFEAHTRYNISGERPNNDFLRYEIAPGRVARRAARGGGVPAMAPATRGAPEGDGGAGAGAGAEPPARRGAGPAPGQLHPRRLFYAYVFGDRAAYRPLLARSGALLPVLRSSPGRLRARARAPTCAPTPRASSRPTTAASPTTVTALGVAYTAAIETTTETPAAALGRDQPHLDTGIHRPGGHRSGTWRPGLGKPPGLG